MKRKKRSKLIKLELKIIYQVALKARELLENTFKPVFELIGKPRRNGYISKYI
jgi:hypothetical protein